MLSRIANSLYWMGRYLERAEHTARYTKVHYFSTLDAPLAQRKEFVLESILRMTGLLYEFKSKNDRLVDEEVVYTISLDESNLVSIKSSINSARENARGARGSISGELWESINKFYHYVNNYTKTDLKRTGIYNFSDKILENCAVVNGYIDNSLIHNEVWAFIHLGIRIERASQITRILISKLSDMEKEENSPLEKAAESYQCMTLLKSAEAFDMSRTYYQSSPNYKNTLEFLILNNDFPRAISYNITRIGKFLSKINPIKSNEKDSLEFTINKISSYYKYLTIEEIEKDVSGFLYNTLGNINNISDQVSKKYLNY
jgi:uncharacterized alpha-E superfamily protein